MTDLKSRTMVKLGDSDLTVANKDEDIRGRSVLDSTGEKIGEVKDLMIDEGESKVRFMQIGAGGVLGRDQRAAQWNLRPGLRFPGCRTELAGHARVRRLRWHRYNRGIPPIVATLERRIRTIEV